MVDKDDELRLGKAQKRDRPPHLQQKTHQCKDRFMDSVPVHDAERYCRQSHKGCFYETFKKIKNINLKKKDKDKID